jgi:DNA-binding IclR family transcriptional regulator
MSPAAGSRGRKPEKGEPLLDRAFKLLSAFDPDGAPLTLNSLSLRSGMPKSSTYRLAQKLVELGALERDSDGLFVIGLRLLEIASLAPRGHGLRATALPYLEDLHRATKQHVLLAVRDGAEAVLLERLSARGAGRVMFRVGGRLPLHSTGVGLVLLAHAPRELIHQVLAGDLRLEPEQGSVSSDELRTQLAAIRREGTGSMSRPQPEPMTSVAAPIFVHDQRVIAAISVVAPSATMQREELRPAVLTVARAISRALRSASHYSFDLDDVR